MFPAKYQNILFGLFLSGFMSCLVSGVSSYKAVGWVPNYFSIWASGWALSWLVAFPAVLVAAPLVRKLVAKLVREG